MPKRWEIMDFSKQLSDMIGYKILEEVLRSEVALLSRLEKPIRFDQ
jgi:wyosine [tRNA(Phe)-imidazoG37] synthetase (radical SAM superfamily)